jgi:hypothetical protein
VDDGYIWISSHLEVNRSGRAGLKEGADVGVRKRTTERKENTQREKKKTLEAQPLEENKW